MLGACGKKRPAPSPIPQTTTAASREATTTPEPVEPDAARPSPCLQDLPALDQKAPAWGSGVTAKGTLGVVTSVDASATRAGIEILEAGGNAVDAAVATALALAVTHPSAGNLGGGGFAVLRMGDRVDAIDFREDSPKKLTTELFWKMIAAGGRGPASVGVPGTVAGLFLAHERHGKIAWRQVVAPALELAKNGYELGERQAKTIAWAAQDLRKDPVANQQFFPGGKLPKAGSRIKRPRLAVALQRIQEQGPRGFYEGPTAADLVSSLGEEGLLTLDDLKNYQAKVRDPLFFDFGNFRVIAMPPPSAGGVAVTQSLLMLEKLGVEETKPDTAARLHLIAEVGRRAQAERQLFVVAPESLSQEMGSRARERVLDPNTWLAKHPVSKTKATDSSSLDDRFPAIEKELQHTTHLSVIDGSGGLVSLTVTLSGSFGARVFTKETGIVLNNSVASFSSAGQNTPAPAQRTTSSMSPTLVIGGEDLSLVLGSPGGNTIPSTVTQTFLSLVIDGLSLVESVDKYRVHQTFAPGHLVMEDSRPLPTKLQRELRALGHELKISRASIGDANIAARIGTDVYAVADPREGGLALAAQPKKAPSSETK